MYFEAFGLLMVLVLVCAFQLAGSKPWHRVARFCYQLGEGLDAGSRRFGEAKKDCELPIARLDDNVLRPSPPSDTVPNPAPSDILLPASDPE